MTVITMPDGQAVDFGDMPSNEIKTLIRRKYPDRYPAADAAAKPAAPTQPPYSGELLPFSKDEQGNVSFDLNAGLLGVVKRAVEFPAAAMRGEIDPKSDEGIARAVEAATVASPVSPASRAGIGWAGVPLKSKTTAVTPPAAELKSTGKFGFNLAREMDVRYHISYVQKLAFQLQSKLFKDKFRDREHSAPGTFDELRGLLKPPEQGAFASIDDLHSTREALQEIAQNPNTPTDAKAAVIVIKAIDDFIENPNPASVLAGDAATAGRIWKDAKANYARGTKSHEVMGIETESVRGAKAANSGLNIDNKIRQRVATLLKSPQFRSGLSPAEIKLLETVADGTATRNTLRWAGNILGGGAGVAGGIAGGAGFAAFGPLGTAAAIAAPVSAKLAGNKLTKNALRAADEALRQRSPLYEERLATAPVIPPASPALRSAPLRGGAAVPLARNGRSYGPVPAPPQMTPEQWNEYLRQKYFDQGA